VSTYTYLACGKICTILIVHFGDINCPNINVPFSYSTPSSTLLPILIILLVVVVGIVGNGLYVIGIKGGELEEEGLYLKIGPSVGGEATVTEECFVVFGVVVAL